MEEIPINISLKMEGYREKYVQAWGLFMINGIYNQLHMDK
ncbi:hypothetical protein GCM10007984_11380 [Shewanella putrefaciens]|nr:hypothetical protein SPWS13_1110 [Shewanella putrefaciens]GGN14753.1 hypothetical protein GCM10007984_11380 [Shewanella putrefaciens]